MKIVNIIGGVILIAILHSVMHPEDIRDPETCYFCELEERYDNRKRQSYIRRFIMRRK